MIFPEYIASTEFYHKLHAEALAYTEIDLKLLDKITNTEAILGQKNKKLIPLFLEVRKRITTLKQTYQQIINNKYIQLEKDLLTQNLSDTELQIKKNNLQK